MRHNGLDFAFPSSPCACYVIGLVFLLLGLLSGTSVRAGELLVALREEETDRPAKKVITLDSLTENRLSDTPAQNGQIIKASTSKSTRRQTHSKSTALSLDLLDAAHGDSKGAVSSSKKTGPTAKSVVNMTGSSAWRDNLRKAIDVSLRTVYSGPSGDFGAVTVVGLDLLKVFTNNEGDWGVLTLQPYFTRIDNIDPLNESVFDDRHDFELVYRICNFNYTGRGKGKSNFRIGHFEVPFGLEHVINTNGTIRDFTHFLNIGFDSDWGVSINGESTGIEYELGLSRGSGNNFRSRDDPYIVAARVGTPRSDPVAIGVSALHGEVLQFDAQGGTSRRTRVGIDGVWADEKFIWLGELSAGFEDLNRVYTGLIEADWYNRDETLLIYNQFVVRGLGPTTGWDHEVRNSIGFRRQCNNKWVISGQVSHFFDRFATASRGTEILWQARYRF